MHYSVLISLILLGNFSNIMAANNTLIEQHSNLIDQCVLFKYSPDPNKVLKASGLYADYTQFVTETRTAENTTENVFYEFLEIFNKTENLLSCHRIKTFCMIRIVPRVTYMNQLCYKTNG